MSDATLRAAGRLVAGGVDPEPFLSALSCEATVALAMKILQPKRDLRMPNMTDDEATQLAKRLGLRLAGPVRDEEALSGPPFPASVSLWGRQTGRTTRMILDALVVVQQRRLAVIVAPTVGIALYIERTAMAFADAIDLPAVFPRAQAEAGRVAASREGLIRSQVGHLSVATGAVGLEDALRGSREAAVFFDHTWHEFAEAHDQHAALLAVICAYATLGPRRRPR